MATRKQQVKVGLFLVVCIGLIAAMLLQVTGFYRNPGNIYWMEFDESVLGLYEGGLVEYLGVPVGKVDDITVVPANRMRGLFQAGEAADAAGLTPPGAAPDFTLVLGNAGDEDYHVIDASSPQVYDGPMGVANPAIKLLAGKRYAFTVIDAEQYPLQILAMAGHFSLDTVLLAQGETEGLLEDDEEIGWEELRDGAQGTVSFTVTPKLLDTMRAAGKVPGYRCPVHVFRAHVDLLIEPGTTLHEGIEGQIVIYSLAAGTMAISLSGGDAQTPVLQPNSQIQTKTSMVAAISTRVETLITNLSAITEQIRSGMEGLEPGSIADTVTHINATLEEAQAFLSDGRVMLGETTNTITSLREDAKKVIDEALSVAEDMRKVMDNVNNTLNVATAKLESIDTERTQEQLSYALEEMGKLAANLNKTVTKFEALSANMMHEGGNVQFALRTALSQIAEAFDALRNLLQQVKEDPASLLRGAAKTKEPAQ